MKKLLFPLVAAVQAAVYVGFPFSEQLPTVARAGQPYLFTLANGTYKLDSGAPVEYSVQDMPSWMAFDAGSRTFSGLPQRGDVANFSITLIGTDSSDQSSIQNSYPMVVSADPGLRLLAPDVMFTQIAQYGNTDGQNGLVVRPGDKFNVKFLPLVFVLEPNLQRPIVAHYGRLADRSSLPNWVSFDADSLSFSGTVPYVVLSIAPSFTYGFSFIGLDYTGFAGAEGLFNLVVGAHQLSTSINETIKVNGTLHDKFQLTVPVMGLVFLDEQPIQQANISAVYGSNLPDYVTLGPDYQLSGTFPNQLTFDNFSIVVRDTFGNQVELPYLFDALGLVFTVDLLPDVNATKGLFFSYQLMQSVFTDYNGTTVSADFLAPWMTFHSDNQTFNGQAPSNLGSVAVNVKASSDFDLETKLFNITGISKSQLTQLESTSSSTSNSAASDSSAASTAPKTGKSHPVNHKALVIGLAVGVPAFVLLVAAIFALCCCARRRKNKKAAAEKDDEFDASSVALPELNGPGFGMVVDKDDHNEKAKQLSSLNVLKLDDKNKDTTDMRSTSSSITHVEDESDGSKYFDASERPHKSWRANDMSDNAIGGTKLKNRDLDASMSTVNTEQLFSVRLVEDASGRNSQQSSLLGQFLSSNSLNGLLRRDNSSGNIQRLDSDGNIVTTATSSPSERPRVSRSPSANLDVLVEENSRSFDHSRSYDTIQQKDRSFGSSLHNDTSSGNLLSKFDASRQPSGQQLSQYSTSHSLAEDFRAAKDPDGGFRWLEDDAPRLVSPISDTFGAQDTASEAHTLHSLPMKHPNLLAISLTSNNSDTRLDRSTSVLGKRAKLVEFTRKASLRDLAYEPDYNYQGHTATIVNDDSD